MNYKNLLYMAAVAIAVLYLYNNTTILDFLKAKV